uniref:hypothetical protein n=1 Tax=Herbidospora sakaeratensis TaxID=564415 RepID=UPI000AF32FCE|nr:hypothetical protein [Herbidospora sakaeratensis]
MTTTGINVTNASWWAEVIAATAGMLTGLVLQVLCIGPDVLAPQYKRAGQRHRKG